MVDVIDADLLIDDLRRLVDVESPSRDVEALTASATGLAALIRERTGIRATIVDGPLGPHVHWSAGGDPKVLILGHHDTVFPLGTLDARPFAITGARATGPGVFDMKAGIVQAIHAVAALGDRVGVEMLFTSDEEVGSTTSRALVEERATACGNVLVLEPSGDGGAVKTGRKGCGTFYVDVQGRAAHAGLDPEHGINALVEAAHQVIAIAALGEPDAGTTVTPSVASAGTTDNVVPAAARVVVDVRVTSADEARRIERAMADLVVVDDRATVSVSGAINRPPMPESASETLFPLACEIDPDLEGVAVGGASDGNFTAALGVPTLDGLGAVGGGAHADHEWIDVTTMPSRVRLVHGLLERLAAGR